MNSEKERISQLFTHIIHIIANVGTRYFLGKSRTQPASEPPAKEITDKQKISQNTIAYNRHYIFTAHCGDGSRIVALRYLFVDKLC